jgi:hypothetical protein
MKRSIWLPGAATLAAIVGISFSLPAARADTVYDWTISGGTAQDGSGALSGSGTITLSSTPTINSTGTGYAVDGITGTFTSTDITGSVTGTFTSGAVDNLVYPSDPGGFILDDFGLGITVMVSPTNSYQLEFGAANGDPGFYNETCCGSSEPIYDYNDVTFGVTAETVSATPLPAALPLFAGGLGILGMFSLRKKRRAEKALVAAA